MKVSGTLFKIGFQYYDAFKISSESCRYLNTFAHFKRIGASFLGFVAFCAFSVLAAGAGLASMLKLETSDSSPVVLIFKKFIDVNF